MYPMPTHTHTPPSSSPLIRSFVYHNQHFPYIFPLTMYATFPAHHIHFSTCRTVKKPLIIHFKPSPVSSPLPNQTPRLDRPSISFHYPNTPRHTHTPTHITTTQYPSIIPTHHVTPTHQHTSPQHNILPLSQHATSHPHTNTHHHNTISFHYPNTPRHTHTPTHITTTP
jgi:hypothetical protein